MPQRTITTRVRRHRGPVRVRLAFALVTLAAFAAATTLSACSSARPGTSTAGRPTGILSVLGPASLTEPLHWLAESFETVYPGVDVRVTIDSDSHLVARVVQGQRADVLIVEGPAPLAALSPTPPNAPVAFAGNQLVIAVAPGNPKRITRLADLGQSGLRVAICDPAQQCGMLAATSLNSAGVTLASPLLVADVRSARTLVENGSADAALVYRTDARAAADLVSTVEFTESGTATTQYEAVIPAGAGNPNTAEAFIAFLGTDSARQAFATAGFRQPQ